MKAPPDLQDVDQELLALLRSYTALDNPVRLKAYLLIRTSPEIAFHTVRKALGVESGLLAYHLGVLKAANIVEMTYSRSGREITKYRLSERGKELYAALFPRRGKTSARTRRAPVQAAPH